MERTNILDKPGRKLNVQGEKSERSPSSSDKVSAEGVTFGVEKGYRTKKAIHAVGLTALTLPSQFLFPLMGGGGGGILGNGTLHSQGKGVGYETR
jgi:hypothetical protein